MDKGKVEAENQDLINVTGSNSISDGRLYSVEERLNTFKVPHCSWPFDSGACTPLKISEAGFYYCGTVQNPDWVRCVVCHQNIDGWEENDDPLEEHRCWSSKCPFIKVKDPYNITLGDVLDLEKAAIDYYLKLETNKLACDVNEMIEIVRKELVASIEQKKREDGIADSA